jgi:ribonuclease R
MVGERTNEKYRLGDRVTIKVARVDLETTKIDFSLVKKSGSLTLATGEDANGRKSARSNQAKVNVKSATKPNDRTARRAKASTNNPLSNKAPSKATKKSTSSNRKNSRKNKR